MSEDMPDRLMGRWSLIDYILEFDDGAMARPIGARPFGSLIYRPDWMSAHLVAEGGDKSYMSYCGPWSLDGDVIRHEVRACDWPGVIGKRLKRSYEWQGETLVLIARNAPHEDRRGTGRLRWQRAD